VDIVIGGATISISVSIFAASAQRCTGQHTAADRSRAHRVAQPDHWRRFYTAPSEDLSSGTPGAAWRTRGQMAPGRRRRSSQYHRTRSDCRKETPGRWRNRAARVEHLRRHAAAVDSERRANIMITRPIFEHQSASDESDSGFRLKSRLSLYMSPRRPGSHGQVRHELVNNP